MDKKILLNLFALFLTACATSPNELKLDSSHLKVPSGQATIYLYRGKTFKSGMAGIIGTIGHNNITINQTRSIELNNGEYYIVDLNPGKHEIEWSLVIMGYEKEPEQVRLSLKEGDVRLINFSDIEISTPSDKVLKTLLPSLEFMERIQ